MDELDWGFDLDNDINTNEKSSLTQKIWKSRYFSKNVACFAQVDEFLGYGI